MDKFYDMIDLPGSCKVDKIIEKNKFYNMDKIDDDYKTIFTNYVDEIKIKYSLKSDILGINKMQDKFQEYSEIEILEVKVNNYIAVYDIATVIGRNIPYPLIIFFVKEDKFKIGTYWVRENKIKNYKNIVENIVFTGWFKKEKYFGRINNIISAMNFKNLKKDNMYSLFNSYYQIITRYKSNYISVKDVCDAFSQIKGFPKQKEHILKWCVHTTVDENAYNKLDIYKRNKMDKYNNNILNEKIMVCKDDLYQFISEKTKVNFKNFDEFYNKINFLKRRKSINDSLKRTHNKWDCMFFDGRICINSKCDNYEKPCHKASACIFFKREYKTFEGASVKRIDTSIYFSNKEENKFNNTKLGIVEYGDIVEVLDINNNKKRLFSIIKNNNEKLPDIPEICINKRIGYIFCYKGTEYKINNVKKNNEQSKKQNLIEDNKDKLLDDSKIDDAELKV